ncbi:MAG: hypothetical protein WKG07_42965 [Hymenobacter sp.]
MADHFRPGGPRGLQIGERHVHPHAHGRYHEAPTPLEITADPGPLAMNDGAQPEDPLRMFKAELQRNVLEPTDTATYGYARLVVTKVKTTRTGRSLQAAQVDYLPGAQHLRGAARVVQDRYSGRSADDELQW